MAAHFVTLCQAIATQPDTKLSQLALISADEKQQLLSDFNHTHLDDVQDNCIHALFQEQVVRHPEQIALVHDEQTLTYQQLYDKSHELALYLQSIGVKPDTLVGVCMARSLDMVVGMLGILQAGGAYVPLDPEYPKTDWVLCYRTTRPQWY